MLSTVESSDVLESSQNAIYSRKQCFMNNALIRIMLSTVDSSDVLSE